VATDDGCAIAGPIERVDHGVRMEQVFTAPTVEEANRKADQWLAQQKDIHLLAAHKRRHDGDQFLQLRVPNGR
jgi:hypothetical protein